MSGEYTVIVSHDGYVPVERSVQVPGARVVDVAVTLRALMHAGLAGEVLDSQGLALPGATVDAVSAGAPVLVGVTDAAGRFSFSPVRPGTWRVSGRGPRFR